MQTESAVEPEVRQSIAEQATSDAAQAHAEKVQLHRTQVSRFRLLAMETEHQGDRARHLQTAAMAEGLATRLKNYPQNVREFGEYLRGGGILSHKAYYRRQGQQNGSETD